MALFAKFKAGLQKTHSKLAHEIKRIVTRSPKLTGESLDELEQALISADLGLAVTQQIVEAVTNGYNQWTFDLEPGQSDEYRLSGAMDRLLKDGHVDLEVVAGPDGAWIGLLHRADVGPVKDAIAAAVERGDYPPSVKKAIRG